MSTRTPRDGSPPSPIGLWSWSCWPLCLRKLTAASPSLSLSQQWVTSRQMRFEGGFQGRCNKLVDGCYSFWQAGLLPLLHRALHAQGERSCWPGRGGGLGCSPSHRASMHFQGVEIAMSVLDVEFPPSLGPHLRHARADSGRNWFQWLAGHGCFTLAVPRGGGRLSWAPR